MFRTVVICLIGCSSLFAAKAVRTAGGLIEGVPASDPSVEVYRGIPYAAPPVGDLRWREPKPAAPWKSTLKTDRFSKSCMQASPSTTGPWTEEFMDQNERSEDCLYLNVWTTATQEKRPVLFWIHGGAFNQGSTSVAVYDGEAMARKGVVVVTTNYRLGVFGFLSHPELTKESSAHASGNYGLLDLIAALKWVQANIAAFGGDPARVTIAGQSAGASAVNALLVSPLAKGLFRGAIAQSGSSVINRIRRMSAAEAEGEKFMAAKGARTLQEMRTMPVYQVLAPVEGVPFQNGPIIDGWFMPDTPGAIYARGQQNDVPTLTGYTADEGSSDARYGKRTPEEFQNQIRGSDGRPGAVPTGLADEFLKQYPAATADQAGQSQVASARDQNLMSTFAWAKQRSAAAKTPVYTYLWDHPAPGPTRDRYGAFHSSELPYVFNSFSRVKRPWEAVDREIGEKMSSYWANFVKTGDPNGPGLVAWPVFDPKTPVTMQLGDRFGPRPIAEDARVRLFEAVFEKMTSADAR